MQNPKDGNSGNGSRSPAKAQRTSQAGLIDSPTIGPETDTPNRSPVQDHGSAEIPAEANAAGVTTAVAGTRRFATGGRDKTAKMVIAALALTLVGVLMLVLLSDKGKQNSKKNEPSLGRPKQEQQSGPVSRDKTSVVPESAMKPVMNDKTGENNVSAQDIEATRKYRNSAEGSGIEAVAGRSPSVVGSSQNTLAHIPQFQPQTDMHTNDNWAPAPYSGAVSGAMAHTDTKNEKDIENLLAKPSIVFVAARDNGGSPGNPGDNSGPTLTLPIGSRFLARLASVATSAVEAPIIAIIEYNYQRNGEIIVPAGSKAVGRMSQADRSGYVQLHFNHLEMPDGANMSIDALATDTNLGPLKGKVTGTNKGKNIAVRAASGVGQIAAMAVGQNGSSVNSSISEADLLRAQVANNVGRAGDEEVMQLSMQSHPIVTLAAGTKIYVVFEKSSGSNSQRAMTSNAPPLQQRLDTDSPTASPAVTSNVSDHSIP